jgi:hypothetical protein
MSPQTKPTAWPKYKFVARGSQRAGRPSRTASYSRPPVIVPFVPDPFVNRELQVICIHAFSPGIIGPQ